MPTLAQILRELQDDYQRARTRHAQSEAEALEAQRAKAEIEAQLLRAQTPPDSPDMCLACWIFHGEHSAMQPQPGPYGVDVFRCRKCGTTEERRVY